MRVAQINKNYHMLNRIIYFAILFCACSSSSAFADTHTAILKITNPNTTLSETTVKDSDGAIWTQVYVEIPAKLYQDKGWLDTDLHNLRFIDVDSGNIELSHWVLPKADSNLEINQLGLWLLVRDLDAGETETIQIEMVDGSSFYANPRAPANKQTYDRTSYNAAATVFPFYGLNSADWKWERQPDKPFQDNTDFINKWLYSEDDFGGDAVGDAAAKTGNEFTITVNNMKFYQKTNSAFKFYFLSQAPFDKPADLDTEDGYRLFLDDYVSRSDDSHFNRYEFTIKLQKYDVSSGDWVTVAQTKNVTESDPWRPFNNSRHVFDIKVSSSQIFLVINGLQKEFEAVGGGESVTDGKYNRHDNLTEGHIGYDRMGWRRCCGSSINYFTLRRFLDEEATFEVYGNTDLVITETIAATTLGVDVNEIAPDLQQFSLIVGGNTLEDYIFATYSIARTEQIIDSYQVELRNRSTSVSETFLWNINNSDPHKWVVYYCDSSGNNCSQTEPATTVLSPTSSITYTIKFVPTLSALVNGSTAHLVLSVEGQGDGSFDNVRFSASTFGNLGCFWKYKAKQVVTWAGDSGYDDLSDYQVLITITGEEDLQYADENGVDIIITDDHNNVLDFWVKSFDRANRILEAWVKVPSLTGSSGDVDLYVWWDNNNYSTSRSDRLATFDLYEDWENDYSAGMKIGCDDGTTSSNVNGSNTNNSNLTSSSCENEVIDPHGWENVPTPDDFYNWWELDENVPGGSKMMQADVSDSHKSGDKGPFIHRGGLGWDHYEVSYIFHTGTYFQYGGGGVFGNPQYNPVYFNDAGNNWGMEYFSDKFIFRPYSAGIDYTWQYQSNVRALLGSRFPQNDRWYVAKVRVFKNKDSGHPNYGGSFLKVLMSDPVADINSLPDVDSDVGFTEIADYDSPKAFSLDYGGVAFGGWDSGFSFDDIRVRKYTEDTSGNEPVVAHSTVTENPVRPDLMLAAPQITAPIFGGRAAFIEITTTPFAWRGDFTAYYADCYILGDCNHDECTVCGGPDTCPGVAASDCEDSSKIGTFSIFGKIDDTTPKGAGYYLLKRDPGEVNPTVLLPNNRTIYTTNGINTTLLAFDINNCLILQADLGTIGSCVDETTLTPSLPVMYDETEKLIRFVRGYFIDDLAFPRSASRNFDANTDYGNNDGVNAPDEQWKIADALHSNPLLIGVPNMAYGYKDYWQDFVDAQDSRPLTAYFMTNDGILHAIRMASVDVDGYYQADPEAKELWAFVPHAALSKLVETRDSEHEYVADGLLRAIDVKIDHDHDSLTPDEWRTILFGLGGRENTYVFGMDVTDPLNPVLLWEMDADSAKRIGTTLSAPGLGRIDSDNDGILDKWVAVIGSGYDIDYLNNYNSSTAWLTIIDLSDGSILNQIEVSDKLGNVLTDIAVLRDAKTGGINKLYFGDYYGFLWRLDGDRIARIVAGAPLPGESVSKMSEISDLLYKPSDYQTTLLPDDPAFPITAQPRIAKGVNTDEFWVYFGTGDYNEYDASYPNQSFFGLKDRTTNLGPYILTDLVDMTDTTASNNTMVSWFIQLGHDDQADLLNNTVTGEETVKTNNERVMHKAEVYGGLVFFVTYEPLNVPCGGGKSRFYAVDYRSGAFKSGLFLNIKNAGGNQISNVRSVELKTTGITSAPMIMEGESGDGTAVASGVNSTSDGGIENVELNPAAFSTALDILLWREKR